MIYKMKASYIKKSDTILLSGRVIEVLVFGTTRIFECIRFVSFILAN